MGGRGKISMLRSLFWSSFAAFGMLGWYSAAFAVDQNAAPAITFSHDIAPLIYANCSTCHRDGEAAPFPLLTLRDVQKRINQIVDVTSRRYMPPWKAEINSDTAPFLGQRRLTENQLALLKQWCDQGAPEGDPTQTPRPPQFPSGWQ